MDILLKLYDEEYLKYKGLSLLKELINDNEEFRNILIEGINKGYITGFNENDWDKVRSQNVNWIDNFETVFKEGLNIGRCTFCSKQLSYSYDNLEICGGVNKYLVGSANSKDGSHTWMLLNSSVIYDTTFMLKIKREYQERMGYIEEYEKRVNPSKDIYYEARKDYTRDKNIKK